MTELQGAGALQPIEFIDKQRALELVSIDGLFQCSDWVVQNYKAPQYSYLGDRDGVSYVVKNDE